MYEWLRTHQARTSGQSFLHNDGEGTLLLMGETRFYDVPTFRLGQLFFKPSGRVLFALGLL